MYLIAKRAGEKIATQDALFKIAVDEVYADVRKHNLFNIIRNDESTVEKSLSLLEKHFGL